MEWADSDRARLVALWLMVKRRWTDREKVVEETVRIIGTLGISAVGARHAASVVVRSRAAAAERSYDTLAAKFPELIDLLVIHHAART